MGINQQNKTVQASDDESNEPAPLWGVGTRLTKGDTSNLPPEDDTKVEYMAGVMFYFFIVCIVLLGIYLLCSILLIIGACKGSRWCLLPWIVATFLYLLPFNALIRRTNPDNTFAGYCYRRNWNWILFVV